MCAPSGRHDFVLPPTSRAQDGIDNCARRYTANDHCPITIYKLFLTTASQAWRGSRILPLLTLYVDLVTESETFPPITSTSPSRSSITMSACEQNHEPFLSAWIASLNEVGAAGQSPPPLAAQIRSPGVSTDKAGSL
jgi:hypothetical protein